MHYHQVLACGLGFSKSLDHEQGRLSPCIWTLFPDIRIPLSFSERYSMQGELGDDYVLYLLEDQEENPVAVVLPKDAAEQPLPAAQEVRLPAHPAPVMPAHAPLMPPMLPIWTYGIVPAGAACSTCCNTRSAVQWSTLNGAKQMLSCLEKQERERLA